MKFYHIKLERITIMKKLLALALTALMMVCAIVPAFADDATPAFDALPEDLAGAEAINFVSTIEAPEAFAWGGETSCFPWNSSDFTAGGQFEPLGANTIWLYNDQNTFTIEFMPVEDGAYSFVLYLANKTTQGNGKDPLPSTVAGGYTVTVADEDGTAVGTYTVTEVQPAELGSRLYYRFADGVELKADVNYTATFALAQKTDSCLVDFYFGIPGADDAADDTDAPAADDTDAPAADDTDAPAAPSTPSTPSAPATFDVALIAVAVAGASAAAAAVVSKKRR